MRSASSSRGNASVCWYSWELCGWMSLVPCPVPLPPSFIPGSWTLCSPQSCQHSAPVGGGTATADGLARGDREEKEVGRNPVWAVSFRPCSCPCLPTAVCHAVVARHHHVTLRLMRLPSQNTVCEAKKFISCARSSKPWRKVRQAGCASGDNHAARVRDAALQPVHAHVRAEERYVVGGVHHHTYVRVDGIEGELSSHGRQPRLP